MLTVLLAVCFGICDTELECALAEVERNTVEIERLNNYAAAHTDMHDTGISGTTNFTVFSPSGDFLARKIAQKSEELRKEIAVEWLAAELPEGKEFTHISLTLSDDRDVGRTWLCGPGRGS